MPELPEAQIVASQVSERLLGATLVKWWLSRADMVRCGLPEMHILTGAHLSGVERRGKCVVLQFEREGDLRYLVLELGMTGLVFFRQPHSGYAKHTHLVLDMKHGRERQLRYWNARRFGRLYCFHEKEFLAFTEKRFGHDPLEVSWPAFREMIRSHRRRVKPLLMHQQLLAGIGNIYANELLYRARVHPYRLSNSLRDDTIRRLYDVMQGLLTQAVKEGGSSIRDYLAPDGTRGRFQFKHLVYNKEGALCSFGCGKRVRRLSGERSSFYCPSCQRVRPREVRISEGRREPSMADRSDHGS